MGGLIIEKLVVKGNKLVFVFFEGKIFLFGGGYYFYDFSFSGFKIAVLWLV